METQMIRKTFNKIAAKTFVNKPKAHILPPKAINLHFPNAINSEFKFLNLTNLSSVSFNVRSVKSEGKDEFLLYAQVSSITTNHINNMDIALFKSEEEANTALNDIRVTLYMPKKSFAKWIAVLAVLCGLCCMASMHVKGMHVFMGNKNKIESTVPNTVANTSPSPGLMMPPMPANMNPSQIPPPVDNGEIDKMISQLQEIRNLQGGMPSQQGIPQQEPVQQQPQEQQQQQAPTNPADQFLNGLN
jgi:hypothetical protein